MLRVLPVLAIGQIIGWGTIGLLAVVGTQVAADLHMDISAVFAGNSIFYCARLRAAEKWRFSSLVSGR